MTAGRLLPMFPLGATLLPGMALPLRLFEPRYLLMYGDIIDEDREFGVVLIERGIETRDGSPTFDIGCCAYIVGSGLHDDGTIDVVAIGRHRLRVLRWEESDPYPRAIVEDLTDEPLSSEGIQALESAIDRLPRLLALAAELNPEIDRDVPELSEDPAVATYQLAQLAGLQALDLQKVLQAPTTTVRARLVDELITDTMELIDLQLRMR